tara:strand:- start:1102 stop:1491 length:390 start_codon:yes stop_codon:yes gene_type:complete
MRNNPNFHYMYRDNYTKKQIDKAIVYAYKNGKTKVVTDNGTRYNVKREIKRIQKYMNIPIPISTKTKKINNLKKLKKTQSFNKKMTEYRRRGEKLKKEYKKIVKNNPNLSKTKIMKLYKQKKNKIYKKY